MAALGLAAPLGVMAAPGRASVTTTGAGKVPSAGGGGGAVTWDPAHLSGMTLSPDNLTGTGSTTTITSVRGSTSLASGKASYEGINVVDPNTKLMFGFCNASFVMTTFSSDMSGLLSDGHSFPQGAFSTTFPTEAFPPGTHVLLQCDATAGTFTAKVGANTTPAIALPATGPYFPLLFIFGTAGSPAPQGTGIFTSGGRTVTPDAGFSATF